MRGGLSKRVVLVLGLLALGLGASTIWDSVVRGRDRGRFCACKSNLHNIATALERYATDFGGHYPRNLEQLRPNYLKTLPSCPAAGRLSYKIAFGSAVPSNTDQIEDYYSVECMGIHHQSVGISADYPKYDGVSGFWER